MDNQVISRNKLSLARGGGGGGGGGDHLVHQNARSIFAI